MNGKVSRNGVGVNRSRNPGQAAAMGWPLRLMSVLVAAAVVVAWTPGALAYQKVKEKQLVPIPVKVKVVEGQLQPEGKKPVEQKKSAKLPAEKQKKDGKTLETGKPVLKVDEMVHDFGVRWIGPDLRHTFTITNEGDATLRITKVRPACGCTIAGTYPRQLAPGESGQFPFKISTKKIRNKFEKAITITSNDPTNPNLKIKLAGEVKRYVGVTPSAANFGRIAGQEPQERILTIQNNTEQPLELTMPPAKKGARFTYELVETAPGKTFKLHVHTAPPFTPGSLRDKLQLTTNVDKQKTLDIVVIATIPMRLDIQPRTITLRQAKGSAAGKPVKRRVRFTNYGKKPVKLLEGSANHPDIKVTIKERQEGKAYDVEVVVPPNYEPPAQGHIVTLKTDDPDKPTLTVPIRGPARRAAKTQARPADLMVGKVAPDFELTTTAGKKLTNADLKDAITVLDFFAPNCGFCKKQIPTVEKIRREYEEKGVRFLLVSQTMRKKYEDEQVIDIVKKTGAQGELALDPDNTVGPLFKATSYPTMVMLGKSGKIEAVNIGNVSDLDNRMRKQLDAMIAGKPVPKFTAAARKAPRRPALELVGKAAPTFSFETLAGKTFSNAELANHPATILNFVAPNCGFCKRQVPNVEAVRKEYEPKGVRFINVAQEMRNKKYTVEQVVDIFKDAGSNLELSYDMPENKVGGLFKAVSFPTLVLLGKSGKVEAVTIGAKSDLNTTLKSQLDTLIAGKSLAQAKAKTARPQPIRLDLGKTRTVPLNQQ